ncbi:phosphatase PAP2 family protein [Gordonia sp. VNK21]|uniref:phosphatase PAP2 family protein n=1 Tax=Gordonia sp. VNK21 TaxID=3382483 RepID=UPI0038D4C6F8
MSVDSPPPGGTGPATPSVPEERPPAVAGEGVADEVGASTAETEAAPAVTDVSGGGADESIEVTEEKTRDLTWVRRGLMLVWAAAVILWMSRFGISFDRTSLIVFLAIGMVIATIGRRRAITVLIDWLPFVLILMLYDWTRSIAVWMGMPTHWHLAADVDHAMFGVSPTAWLQSEIKFADPPWWEIITSIVYMSYFIVPYATAAYMWVKDRAVWRRFAACFVAVSFIGLIGYTLVPAAPPWAAAKCTSAEVADYPHDPDCMYEPEGVVEGNLLGPVDPKNDGNPYVERISGRGWAVVGIEQADHLLKKGQGRSNLVAAVPSLHAALTMLLALFMWPRVKALGKFLFMGYAWVMAFTLVYTAEHYVFDILLGWGLAAAVIAVYQLIDKRYIQPRNARRDAERERERLAAVAEATGDGVEVEA